VQNRIEITHQHELPNAALQVLQAFSDKRIFAFVGEMGVGKTTFIKELCKELGVKDNVSSPTFSIVNEYLAGEGSKVYHFDFYRIKSLEEAFDLGYEDYLYSNSYCFIEWSEKINELLPNDVVTIEMFKEGEKRIILAST